MPLCGVKHCEITIKTLMPSHIAVTDSSVLFYTLTSEHTRGMMMKKLQAFIAALIVTGLIGVAIFAIGSNAVANASVSTAKQQATTIDQAANVTVSSQSATDAATQIAQLKNLIAQYQSRETQYKTNLDKANQQLSLANQQFSDATQHVQSLQNVLVQLQQRGIISIQSDGSIQLLVRGRGD